jgi:uncharacterized protein YjbI with pentapeptide repeats
MDESMDENMDDEIYIRCRLDINNTFLNDEGIYDFTNVNFEQADLEGVNLGGSIFERANLQGANLQDINLQDTNFQGANLQGAILRGANLEDAYLEDANLEDAILRGANLQGANLQDTNLQDANLSAAYLSGAYLQGANLQDANLSGAFLSGANLSNTNLQGTNFQGADLLTANLSGAFFLDANLQGADLQGANLQHAILQRANLQGADLQGSNLRNADLREADLRGANVSDVVLENTFMFGANIENIVDDGNVPFEQLIRQGANYGPPPPRAVPAGNAYEVHRASHALLNNDKFLQIIGASELSAEEFDYDEEYDIMKNFIVNNSTLFDDVGELFTKMDMIWNKVRDSRPSEQESDVMCKATNFAYKQDKRFTAAYISTFIDEAAGAYVCDDPNVRLSCTQGIRERFYTSLLGAASLVRTIEGFVPTQAIVLLSCISKIGDIQKDPNEAIQRWSLQIDNDMWKSSTKEQRIEDFKNFMREDYKDDECYEINREAIEEIINKKASEIDYVFDNNDELMFGGKKLKRKNKKTRKKRKNKTKKKNKIKKHKKSKKRI